MTSDLVKRLRGKELQLWVIENPTKYPASLTVAEAWGAVDEIERLTVDNTLLQHRVVALSARVAELKAAADATWNVAIEEAAVRVALFSDDGKYASARETWLCNYLAGAVRALTRKAKEPT